MYRERFQFAIQHFCVSYALLILLFWIIRGLEFVLMGNAQLLPENPASLIALGFAFDIWFCLILAVITFPFYLLSYLILGPFTRYFLAITFVLFLLIYLALVQYYIQTSIPLSSDFWGYSMADIQTTVSSSATVSIFSYIPFAVVLFIFFAYYKRVQEIILPDWVLVIFYVITLGAFVTYLLKTPNPSWFKKEEQYTFCVNKMAFFAEKSAVLWAESHNDDVEEEKPYPLVHTADTADVLSPFFTDLEQKPNLVFIIIEGLGGTFVGPNARYGGCTPFLDSLAQHSLYWQNTLSTTGRTFGVLSSLLGSLPYNDKGFLETGFNMPAHLTMLSLLKQNGYATRYFYGGNPNFDLQDVFLERQGVDYILGEDKFPPSYQKLAATSEGFSWGYSDGDVFKRSLEVFPPDTTVPVFSVYLTLNTHEPFIVPNQSHYLEQLEKLVASKQENEKQTYRQFSKELSSLLYTDDAIRKLMEDYKKRPDYTNSIFVITGDHRMIPIPQANQLDRFHVPFILFSPKLKRAQTFSSINTHHDVVPTFLSFLQHQTDMTFPSKVHWLGKPMDTTVAFYSTKDIAFMRNKNELIDYIYGTTFLSNNIPYLITPNLDLERLSDNGKEAGILRKKLESFKRMNKYVFAHNQIYNDSLAVFRQQEFSISDVERLTITYMGIDTMNADQMFYAARRRAEVKQYDNVRLICKWCLLTNPNFTDIRLTLARTYLWEGNYEEAHKYFADCVKRSPLNEEAWREIIHNEVVFGKYDKALEYAQQAHSYNPKGNFLKQIKELRKLQTKP